MSVWQWKAATGGYAKAHGEQGEEVISTAEADELAQFLDRPPVWLH